MRVFGCFLLAVLCLVAPSRDALATAGFAEWDVYTPGGHKISHNDLWKDEHGDCLRSDAKRDVAQAIIFVSHLKRWRYYRDHVVGESRSGYFIFDEARETVQRFGTRREFDAALDALRLGDPQSAWLTGADGWQEAWFPFMVWKPCRALLAGERAPAIMSEAECRAALAPEKFDLYRRTTWGRTCRQWKQRPPKSGRADSEAALFEDFCDAIDPRP